MGSNQSTFAEVASGSSKRSKQDVSNFSASRPIGAVPSLASSSRPPGRLQAVPGKPAGQGTSLKHNIIIVADGSVIVKDPDPELTRLNTIPVFTPIIKSSLNLVSTSRDQEALEKLDHHTLLRMCLRYQHHLKELAEAVTFDQDALGLRIKEVAQIIQAINSKLSERQKKYHKYVEQFERVTEIVTTLNRVKISMDNIIPRMDHLNQMLPPGDQLEPFALMPGSSTIQTT